MSEATTEEQIETWKTELASAIADKEWRSALQLCSWLRYALDQRGCSDPQVERMHGQAKEALAEQVSRERAAQERQSKLEHLRRVSTSRIVSGHWSQALDAIEAFYNNEASREDTFNLLQTLQDRLSDPLSTAQQPTGSQAAEFKQRFNSLLEQIRSDA
jgi:hypothetical protein